MRRCEPVVWEDAYSAIEPQINADGVHEWRFHSEFPIDVRFLKFGRKRDIRLNRHDYFEMLYVQSGEVTYEVQGEEYHLREADLFIIGSTLLHRMSSYGRPVIKGVVLYFLPDLIRGGEATGDDLSYLMPFLVQDKGFPHVIPASTGIPTRIFDLMKMMALELPARTHRSRLSVKTYLKMALILLANHYSAYRGSEEIYRRKQADLERLRPLFDFLDSHYGEHISVEKAAGIVHMSKSNFMRFFKNATGQPFITYLHHFRIAKAEALLSTTDMPIVDISQLVGFCDQSYFGLIFRNLMGISPREYKQRIRETDIAPAGLAHSNGFADGVTPRSPLTPFDNPAMSAVSRRTGIYSVINCRR
jgi:AraC-like DNA-binding protein/mannose-6-phosphate isomerase-like protein (cupin superfamily)